MKRQIQVVGKTEAEVMEKAQAILRVPANKIFINTLGEIAEGLNCEALIDVNLALEGRRYIENILKVMGIKYQIETRTVGGEKEIHYLVESSENSLLIGHDGRCLEALQTLVRNLISNYSPERLIVTLDIGSYKSHKDSRLEILATKTAKEVARTKIPAKLAPMNSYERHVIHEKLADWRDVYTESEGEGDQRAVVIKPRLNERLRPFFFYFL